ncbi:hypothetical protein QFZ35_003879 [Arthrobacter ulcerisalmonis]|nr:hypothetical protein [Arthrobacter ulcerisalmonis]MDQ0665381.1 hypothetical protein [Arthrobacter ulcerisalmonis]
MLDVSGPLDTTSAHTLRMLRCAVRVAESLLGTSDGGASLGLIQLLTPPVSQQHRRDVIDLGLIKKITVSRALRI